MDIKQLVINNNPEWRQANQAKAGRANVNAGSAPPASAAAIPTTPASTTVQGKALI